MLREISSINCRQFVTSASPAAVVTVVQLCFTPPFKYVVIVHDDKDVLSTSQPFSKEQVEFIYNINLSNDRDRIQEPARMVSVFDEPGNARI